MHLDSIQYLRPGSGSKSVKLNTLVYSGLTPQQQSGSYPGGNCDGEMSVSLVEEIGVPRGNH